MKIDPSFVSSFLIATEILCVSESTLKPIAHSIFQRKYHLGDTDCMTPLVKKMCRTDKASVSQGLVECMSRCLDNLILCRIVTWDPETKTCYRLPWARKITQSGSCLAFKRECSAPSDVFCMHPVERSNFSIGEPIPGVTNEINCKVLCTMWSTCVAITWVDSVGKCTIHTAFKPTVKPAIEGEVYIVKNTKCTPRSIMMTPHSHTRAPGYRTDDTTVGGCLDHLRSSGVLSLGWNEKKRRCSTKPTANHPIYHKSNIIKFSKNTPIIYHRSDIISDQTPDITVGGGSIDFTQLAEKECIEMCKIVRMCVAVTFFPDQRCFVHRHIGKVKPYPGAIMYGISLASITKATTVTTTILTTTTTTTTTSTTVTTSTTTSTTLTTTTTTTTSTTVTTATTSTTITTATITTTTTIMAINKLQKGVAKSHFLRSTDTVNTSPKIKGSPFTAVSMVDCCVICLRFFNCTSFVLSRSRDPPECILNSPTAVIAVQMRTNR